MIGKTTVFLYRIFSAFIVIISVISVLQENSVKEGFYTVKKSPVKKKTVNWLAAMAAKQKT